MCVPASCPRLWETGQDEGASDRDRQLRIKALLRATDAIMTHLADDFQHYFLLVATSHWVNGISNQVKLRGNIGSNSFVTSVGRYRVEREWETHGVDQVLANCSCHQFALNRRAPTCGRRCGYWIPSPRPDLRWVPRNRSETPIHLPGSRGFAT